MDKVLRFKISKDGQKISMEALGFAGPMCQERSRPFLQRLGQVTEDVSRPELWESPQTIEEQQKEGW